MKKKTKTKGQAFPSLLINLIVIFVLFNMLISPARFMNLALDGISAWALNVLPSVLPFMFFTKILSTSDLISNLSRPFSPLSKKLFNTPPISITTFLMAVLSGYPVGSKMVADLYLQGKITQEDAFRMSSFCSTSGPMFIIGAVGIGMFQNAKIGYILFLSHLFGAILNGILYRKAKFQLSTKTEENNYLSENNKKSDLSDIVLSSTQGILNVGCIICIFFIVIECFSPLLSLLPDTINFFFQGIIEITKGCLSLASLSSTFWATILTSFVISFGGISTVLQSLTMLSKVKIPVKIFVLQKFSHACLSCLITIILMLIL